MLSLGRNLGQNYAWELVLFSKFRRFSDGITFLEFQLDTSWYNGDHSPRGNIALRALNFTIFEFEVYNVNHFDFEEEE